MTDIVYYVATSLDGYIATTEGGVEWLDAFVQDGEDYGYRAFFASVDALLMGRKTYEQVLTFGAWPYSDMPCWVFSRQTQEADQAEVTFTSDAPRAVVNELNRRGCERAWLVGGGQLASAFQREGLLTEHIISIAPVILGEGIPLFAVPGARERLDLIDATSYPSGLVQLRYRQAAPEEEGGG